MRVQKAASRVPSAPYNAKCHSNMSSSKGSAHVANALGSVSMCASESMNSFISCEMRRTALFEEENFEVVSVVMSSSSSSRSPRVSASRAFFASLWCADQQSKGSFPLPFFFYEENWGEFIRLFLRARAGKIHKGDVFFSKRGRRGRGRGETTSATAATIVSVVLSQKKTPRKKRLFRFRFFR